MLALKFVWNMSAHSLQRETKKAAPKHILMNLLGCISQCIQLVFSMSTFPQNTIVMQIILFCVQNIDCGYKVEPPRLASYKEYPQFMFWTKKKMLNTCAPQFYNIKVGFVGIYFTDMFS